MKEHQLTIHYRQYSLEELTAEDRELVEEAIGATSHSFSPYSHFQVGAALRLADGRIIVGANQENAAFSACLCAERSAIFAAQAQYPDQPIVALAIAARNVQGLLATPVSPCGECRQVMAGIEDRYQRPMRVLLYGTSGVYVLERAAHLLPLCFVDANMREGME